MESEENSRSLLKEFSLIESNFKTIQESITNVKTMIESLLLKKEKPQTKLENIGITDILELPEELRKSVMAVMKSNGTLEEIIARTKREMGLEKGYLEALVAMNYLRKDTQNKEKIRYRIGLGKRKSKMSDDIWKILIKDSAEMVNFICSTEIEKAQLKLYDIDEMMQMAPQAQTDLNKIKNEINRYISSLEEILLKY